MYAYELRVPLLQRAPEAACQPQSMASPVGLVATRDAESEAAVAVKVGTTRTVTVKIGQLLCGRSCGEHGPETGSITTPKYKAHQKGTGYAYGLPLWSVIGEQLGDGSIVTVTVTVQSLKPLKRNPWLFNAKGARIP